jgi:large repetitive protein
VTGPPSVDIDTPARGALLSGVVTIAGWAIDNTTAVVTAISSVTVAVDGSVVGTATYGVSRTDVCAAWPGRTGCPNVGYTYQLNTATLASGSHTITVFAVDSDVNPQTSSASVLIAVQ